MKVYIGPYIYRATCDLHRKYMDLKYDFDWDQSITMLDHMVEKIDDFLQKIYDFTINKFYYDDKTRNVQVRIDKYDTFNVDDTLTLIILPLLKEYRKNMTGSPMVDDSDVPDNIKSTSAPPTLNDYDTDDFYHMRWEYVVDEMIWAFEQKNRIWWEEDYHPENGPSDYVGRERHQKRMSNGFRLFGKYFEALWQ